MTDELDSNLEWRNKSTSLWLCHLEKLPDLCEKTDLVALVSKWWEQSLDENVPTLSVTKERSCAGLCMHIRGATKRLSDLIPHLESSQCKGNRQTQNYISEASDSSQFCTGEENKLLLVIKIVLEWPKGGLNQASKGDKRLKLIYLYIWIKLKFISK